LEQVAWGIEQGAWGNDFFDFKRAADYFGGLSVKKLPSAQF
jgi:hypothetical protein